MFFARWDCSVLSENICDMTKYMIKGYHVDNKDRQFHLELPMTRKYHDISIDKEKPLREPSILIRSAVRTGRRSDHALRLNPPVVHDAFGPVDFKSAFHSILWKHPYPYMC